MVGMIIGGVLLFVGVVLIPYTDVFIESENKRTAAMLIILGILIFSNLFFATGTNKVTRKSTYINCLRHGNRYKINVRYELRDSTIIPVDTVFTLINKNK